MSFGGAPAGAPIARVVAVASRRTLSSILVTALLANSACSREDRANAVTEDVTAATDSVSPPDPRRVAALVELLRAAETPHRMSTVRAIGDHARWGDRSAFEAIAQLVREGGNGGPFPWGEESCSGSLLATTLEQQIDASNPAVGAALDWMVDHRDHGSPYVSLTAWRGIARALLVPSLRSRASALLDEAAARDELYLREVLLAAALEGHAPSLESLIRMREFFKVGIVGSQGSPLAVRAELAVEQAWREGDGSRRASIAAAMVNHGRPGGSWPTAARILEQARHDPDPRVTGVVTNNEWLLAPREEPPLDPIAWLLGTARSALAALEPNAQVKKDLLDLFNAQKSLHGEYGTYITDLDVLGFTASGDTYAFGFCEPFPADSVIPGICDLDTSRKVSPGGKVADPCAALAAVGLASRFKADGREFTAFAARNLDADPDLEVWSIDHYRTITQISKD